MPSISAASPTPPWPTKARSSTAPPALGAGTAEPVAIVPVGYADGWLRALKFKKIYLRGLYEIGRNKVDEYRARVEPYTLERAERETGVPAEAIRETSPTSCCTGRARKRPC